MSAAKKHKRSKKPIRLETSRLALAGWGFFLLLALLWMFLLGLFVGKGITPASINFAEIKNRMIAQGVWPGSGKAHQREEASATQRTKKQIPLNDLEFYDKLAKKKKAQLQKQATGSAPHREETRARISPSPAVSSQPEAPSQKQQRSSAGRYTVQLASFKDLESAKKFSARFKDSQPKAFIRQVDLTGKGRWYRVQVGELSSRDEAAALAKRFTKKHRLQAFVVGLDGGG